MNPVCSASSATGLFRPAPIVAVQRWLPRASQPIIFMPHRATLLNLEGHRVRAAVAILYTVAGESKGESAAWLE